MPKKKIIVWGIDLKWIVIAVVYPFISWATYQNMEDMGNEMPWYIFIPSSLLGMACGILFVIKVLDPIMRYLDEKVERLLRIKK